MKKAVSTALALLIIFNCAFVFLSCGKKDTSPLTVNGTPINGEIFSYYLNEAFSSDEASTKEDRITYATNMCIRYVAVNSTFKENGLSLTPAESAEVTERTNVLWNMFDTHYTSVGVSKETFMKIQLCLAYTEKLRLSLFDKGCPYEIADNELKAYFSDNYVAFKLIRGYLFTTDVYGNTIEYTEEELTAILDRYNSACEQINDGISIDVLYSTLAGADQQIQQTLNTEVIQDGDAYYPAEFYSRVKEIEEGKAKVCVFGDYLYLVYRVGVLKDSALFSNHRAACLKAVSETPLQYEINRMCNAYTSIRRPKLVEQYYSVVLKEKTNV